MIKPHLTNETIFYIILSIVTVLALFLLKKILVARINRHTEDIKLKHSYRTMVSYTLGAITFIVLGVIWLRMVNVGLLFTIIGAGLVISLSDLILSFLAWIFINIKRPFGVGDRVQIGEVKGDVIDITNYFITLLEIGGWVEEEQSTGRIVNIPNSFIFKYLVYNYTKGFNFIWNEIKITVTFESNYEKAKDICLSYLNEYHASWAENLRQKISNAQESYAIYYKNLTPIVYVKIEDSGVLLSLRYLVQPQSRRSSQDLISRKILDEFANAEDINFAYTTYRIMK